MTKFNYHGFLSSVSTKPGVYRMFNDLNIIIYVGKAKNLKKRLTSYFRSNQSSTKTSALVSHITNIEVTVTHSETEALILEHNFIKQYKPKYNVILRDDKSYPYLFLSAHKHPQLTKVHSKNKTRKGIYFGPYPSGSAVNDSLKLIQKIFPIRQCTDSYYSNRSRPCLKYQLKLCIAPCVQATSDEEYKEQVDLATSFLQGKSQIVIARLITSMQNASDLLDFEKAARVRDQIKSIKKVQEQQWVSGDLDTLDVIGVAFENNIASIHMLFIREGRILGSRNHFPRVPRETNMDEIICSFLSQFYLSEQNEQAIPKEILLSDDFSDREAFNKLFSEQANRKVSIKTNVRTDRAKFIELAKTNAKSALNTFINKQQNINKKYLLLETKLNLCKPIKRMECYDISHTMGEKTVASCVVFNNKGAQKSAYRIFNITGITPGDDYAAMAQVLSRRFQEVQEEQNIPDIIFIDGGIGQLSQAEEIINKVSDNFLGKLPILIGVAKGVTRKAGLETLILGGSHEIINLDSDSPALHLIQEIRDESHRFAITGHRKQRDKKRRVSTLEEIEGIGSKRRKLLLEHFGGLQGVKFASVDELKKIQGISLKLAETIYHNLHK